MSRTSPETETVPILWDDAASVLKHIARRLREGTVLRYDIESLERIAAAKPGVTPCLDLDREQVAKIIYEAFPFTPYHGCAQKPEWTVGGNSFNQDEARRAADRIAALAQGPDTSTDRTSK